MVCLDKSGRLSAEPYVESRDNCTEGWERSEILKKSQMGLVDFNKKQKAM